MILEFHFFCIGYSSDHAVPFHLQHMHCIPVWQDRLIFLSCWSRYFSSLQTNFRLNQAIINTNLSSMWTFSHDLAPYWTGSIVALQYQSRYKISIPNQKISAPSKICCWGERKKIFFVILFFFFKKSENRAAGL